MEITCYRDSELLREPLFLPATVYNTAYLLLEHSKEGVVFVPIRSMQYLAVIDFEEIIFLDSENKSWVAIATQLLFSLSRKMISSKSITARYCMLRIGTNTTPSLLCSSNK